MSVRETPSMPRRASIPPIQTEHGLHAASQLPRRHVLAAGAGLLLALGTIRPTRAQPTDDAQPKADFLYVQTATGLAFDANRNWLSLNGVSPVTLFFSDRPERIAGDMTTEAFVPFWSEGTDSFLSDPPNADLSILLDGTLREVVVELRDPEIDGAGLHYTVRILDVEMPVEGGAVSLFIDVIGMPLTPLSVAGVRRRGYRRAVLR